MNTTLPEKSRGLCQVSRRPKQHCCVPIMAAGMHDARLGRAVGKVGLFIDRQGVHIGAQTDGFSRPLALQHANDTRLANVSVNLNPPALEQICDNARGTHLLEAKLWMRMQLAADCRQFFGVVFNAIDKFSCPASAARGVPRANAHRSSGSLDASVSSCQPGLMGGQHRSLGGANQSK